MVNEDLLEVVMQTIKKPTSKRKQSILKVKKADKASQNGSSANENYLSTQNDDEESKTHEAPSGNH